MGLASSAGAFPLAVIDDSVRCADTGVSVTSIILPSSNGFDSGASLPARPQLCPATSQPVLRFELSKYHVTVTSHRNASTFVNPSRKWKANIPRPNSSSRETFRQLFPEQSHAISWKTLLRLFRKQIAESAKPVSLPRQRRSTIALRQESNDQTDHRSRYQDFPEIFLTVRSGHQRYRKREQRAHR